jgi:hypothetical protein
LAVISAVNVGVFMAIMSCLPDISPAKPAGFDGGGEGGVVVVPPAQCGNGVIELDAGEQCDPGEAGAIGCSSCQIACEGGFVDDTSGHCYFALDASVQYTNAGPE